MVVENVVCKDVEDDVERSRGIEVEVADQGLDVVQRDSGSLLQGVARLCRLRCSTVMGLAHVAEQLDLELRVPLGLFPGEVELLLLVEQARLYPRLRLGPCLHTCSGQ